MDVGVSIMISALVVVQVIVCTFAKGHVANPGLMRGSFILSVVTIGFYLFGLAFLGSTIVDREFAVIGVIFLGLSLAAYAVAILLMFLSFDLFSSRASEKSKPKPKRRVDPQEASYRKLFWNKKREVNKLREQIEDLESRLAGLGDDADEADDIDARLDRLDEDFSEEDKGS